MRILVTGAGGFAGSHLIEHLESQGHEVLAPKIELLNATDTEVALAKTDPEGVIHLAAIAAVGESLASPAKILRNNIFAQLNLLESLRRKNSATKILLVCSADEYGKSADEPIAEDAPLLPTSPYAVSKVGQDFLGLQYFLGYGMDVIRVRPFNHIGERQTTGFVVPDFVKQIVAIERSGGQGVVRVGNLEAVRDFTDVKDMVKAYELALTRGEPGEVYNIGSGRGISIKDLLNQLISLSTAKISIKVDPTRLRVGDQPQLVCNPGKFQALTGWKAEIPLKDTLVRVLEYWRNN